MNKLFFTLLFTLHFITVLAQPVGVKKLSPSIFRIEAFDKNNDLIGTSYGFYIDQSGEAVGSFTPFIGATHADVIDSRGKRSTVECVLGADGTYNLVRFRVSLKRSVALTIDTIVAKEGDDVWLLVFKEGKDAVLLKGKVNKTEVIRNGFFYYTLDADVAQDIEGMPIFNDNGAVIGVAQASHKGASNTVFATSICLPMSLKMNGLSHNDPVLKSTYIKKALPQDLDQAVLLLYLMGASRDTTGYSALVNDFIEQFPNSPDGYISRAQLLASMKEYSLADEDMLQAIKVSNKKDETHYSYATLIFSYLSQKEGFSYAPWTMEFALKEIDQAYSINPLSPYLELKASMYEYSGQYEEARNVYRQLLNSGNHEAETFFLAARCEELLGDSVATLALLDSAINMLSKPYLKEAAPYLLARAQALVANKQYRKAVIDYNDYEKLMSSKLNDNFYYIRALVESDAKMYQQALNDLDKAISLNKEIANYHAEKAVIFIHLGLIDEAFEAATECINVDNELSDGYLLLGLAQCLKGDKAQGMINLQKALNMGNEQAQSLIETYGQ